MRIDFPLLSIISVGFLLFFALQGGDVELHSIEIGLSATFDGVRVTVDPVWIVWANPLLYTKHCGFTFGNVAVIEKDDRGTFYGSYILAHENNHIEQFQALGWLIYPARFLVDIEPPKNIRQNWNDPSQPDHTMWLPPNGWRDLWHFFSLSVHSQ